MNENMDNREAYENDKEKTEDVAKRGYYSGIVTGALISILTTIFVILSVLVIMLNTGFIKLGNGTVYVNSGYVSDDAGIGTKLKDKLDSIDGFMKKYFYFDDVDDEAAEDEILKAYMKSYGDKYTTYYTAEEYQSILQSTSGKFYGLGILCQAADDGSILVLEVYDDTPGQRAGIKADDRIYKVDGVDITQIKFEDSMAMIKGEKGTYVELEILRGESSMTISAQRDEVHEKTVEAEMLQDSIGYVLIEQFEDVTTQQFKDAVEKLEEEGMKGLVIDVRDNPGGVLDGVIEILDYILEDGEYVYTENALGNIKKYSGDDGHEVNIPIAVLVNGSSASAAEIFAGVMQDYDKACIIGTKTFGKGIVQSIQPLSDGSAIKYTFAKYFTSKKNQDVHGNGITPDEVVELPNDAVSDYQLESAIEYIKQKL